MHREFANLNNSVLVVQTHLYIETKKLFKKTLNSMQIGKEDVLNAIEFSIPEQRSCQSCETGDAKHWMLLWLSSSLMENKKLTGQSKFWQGKQQGYL